MHTLGLSNSRSPLWLARKDRDYRGKEKEKLLLGEKMGYASSMHVCPTSLYVSVPHAGHSASWWGLNVAHSPAFCGAAAHGQAHNGEGDTLVFILLCCWSETP